jgi:hypothetical protein
VTVLLGIKGDPRFRSRLGHAFVLPRDGTQGGNPLLVAEVLPFDPRADQMGGA